MKNDLKISTLSIVCVLCAAIAAPAFGAASVRSLGGVGTYSSASNAAAAKSNSTTTAKSNAATAVRGGSMRVGNTASGVSSNRVGSSRAATTPRLSVGKYLAGSSAVSGGASVRPGGSSSDDGKTDTTTGNLQQRIRALEEFMGYATTGDNIPERFQGMEVKVEELAADLKRLTAGAVTDVKYADGKLTVTANGADVVYDLSADFAEKSELELMQDAIDKTLEQYAKVADIPSLVEVETAIKALQDADVAMDTLVKSLQGGKVDESTLSSEVSKLAQADAGLQAAIDVLEESMASIEGLVGSESVAALVEDLKVADAGLQAAINKNASDMAAAVSGLNTAIDGLKAADLSMAGLLQDLQAAAATKVELAEVKSDLEEAIAQINAGQAELKNYYTKTEADAKFATIVDVEGALTAYAKTNEFIALQSTVSENASKIAKNATDIAAAQNMADLNAAEIEALAKVAKSGSYNDLIDQPDLAALRSALEAQINSKANSAEVTEALTAMSKALDDLDKDTYSQEEVNKKIEDALTGLGITGYATLDALDAVKTALDSKDVELASSIDALSKSLSTNYTTTEQLQANFITKQNVNDFVEIKDGSVTSVKLADGSVTADKIDTELPAGTMVMLVANADGTSEWVPVTVDKE